MMFRSLVTATRSSPLSFSTVRSIVQWSRPTLASSDASMQYASAEAPRTVASFNSRMAALCSSGSFRQVEPLFRSMEEAGLQPDTNSYASLTQALARSRDFDKLVSVYDGLVQKGVSPSLAILNNMIRGACFVNRSELARSYFSDIRKYELKPNQFSFNFLMEAESRNRNYEAVFSVFEDMKKEELSPTVATYTTLIYSCVLQRKSRLAKKYLEEAIAVGHKIPVHLYRNILLRTLQLGDADLVASVIQALQQNAPFVRFDEGTLLEILTLACRSGRFDLAMTSWSFVETSGISPSSALYSALLDCCGRSSEIESGFRVLAEIASEDIPITIGALDSLTNSIASSVENIDSAFYILEQLASEEPSKASTSAMNCIIEACGRRRQLDRAFAAFSEMEKNLKITPNADTYAAVIGACATVRKTKSALRVIAEMREKDIKLSDRALRSVVMSFVRSDDPSGAENFLKETIPSNSIPSSCGLPIVRKYGRLRQFDQAISLLTSMQANSTVSEYQYSRISAYLDSIQAMSAEDYEKMINQARQRRRERRTRQGFSQESRESSESGDANGEESDQMKY